ncbi:MAG: PBP1A family penicillin-binding protein [Fibrobacterales bacterium]
MIKSKNNLASESARHWYSLTKTRLLVILILAIPVVGFLVGGITVAKVLQSDLPSLEQLENIKPKLITKVYDKDSNLVHEFFVEKRIWISIDSVPDILPNAIMAIEDREFYNHWGINPMAILSAIKTKLTGGSLRGASTLTQQLTKNLYLTFEKTLERKIKEALTAIEIEKTYTKREILEFYINTVYLGAGAYGFEAACETYFGHSLKEVTIAEAALLAGLLQRPEGYRPDKRPEAALKRRKQVLFAMKDVGRITVDEYLDAIDQPIAKAETEEEQVVGGYFIEEIRKYLEKKYGEASLYSEGISIYSTLDREIQEWTEAALVSRLDTIEFYLQNRVIWAYKMVDKLELPKDTILAHFDSLYHHFDTAFIQKEVIAMAEMDEEALKEYEIVYPDSMRYRNIQGAAVIIDNTSGGVVAMVGGRSFDESKFNRATQSYRQPGSSFKPFVYATAIDNGANPADSINDQPITIPDPTDSTKVWRPDNYGHKFSGWMTLRSALYRSKNLPAIQTGLKYGLRNIVNYAKKFGLKSRLRAVPSLAIGSIGATLKEMTSAYTVFPNGGTRIEPYMINKIESKNKEVIEKNFKQEQEVISSVTAFLTTSILEDVNKRGTAAKVYREGFKHPSGGKTGTTNNYNDAWYIGFSKQYTMGIWLGHDDHKPVSRGHTGGGAAAPVFIEVMKKIHEELPKLEFEKPYGVSKVDNCSITHLPASPNCAHTYKEYYNPKTKTDLVCDGLHRNSKKREKGATIFSTVKKKNTKKSKRRKRTF